MGTITLSTRRTNLASLIGAKGTITPALERDLTDAVQRSLRTIYRRAKWPWLESEWRVELESAYNTGTLSSSGTTVTGSGTTFPDRTVTYERLRTEGEIYRVASRDTATQLTLTDTPLKDITAGAAYNYYLDRYVVGTDVARITDMWLANLATKRLRYIPPQAMDEKKGTLWLQAHPQYWTTRGVDSSGDFIIELYPVPGVNEILHVRGRTAGTIPTADGGTDDIPDRFSDVVDDLARMYLYEQMKDERVALAMQRAERALVMMIDDANVNDGEGGWQLDPELYHQPEYWADSVVTTTE